MDDAANKRMDFERKYEEFFSRKLANSKLFNEINKEKPTKSFFNLLSDHQTNESPSTKLRKNGLKYNTSEEAREDLKGHFENIFRSKENERTGTIPDFLGELKDSDEVLKRRLTEEEKVLMDKPVSVTELKEVLKKPKQEKPLDQTHLTKYS